MILSDSSIIDAIESGELVVEPDVRPAQIQPASLDVRIGETLRDPVTDESLDTLTVRPFRRYHAYTQDYFEFPDSLAGMLTGRSSFGRMGLIVHKTAGWFDPGFCGNAKMELFSFSNKPITFTEGERIAQMVFFPLDAPSEGYDGQFQGQGPEDE